MGIKEMVLTQDYPCGCKGTKIGIIENSFRSKIRNGGWKYIQPPFSNHEKAMLNCLKDLFSNQHLLDRLLTKYRIMLS